MKEVMPKSLAILSRHVQLVWHNPGQLAAATEQAGGNFTIRV